MGTFLITYIRVLLFTTAAPLLFGVVCCFCNRLFCLLVGHESGRPLMLAVSVLSTPLREAGHAIFAVLFCHRIEGIALFTLRGEEGELGYVEHSYNPRNPVALLGNLFFAAGPVSVGLFAVLIVLLVFFRGTTDLFFSEVAALGEAAALDPSAVSFADCARTALHLLPDLFRAPGAAWPLRVLGCLLLFALVEGIYISPVELRDAWSGLLVWGGVLLAFTGVISMFGPRLPRIVLMGLRSFSTGVTALFSVVLVFDVCLLAVGCVVFLVRQLFGLDAQRGE